MIVNESRRLRRLAVLAGTRGRVLDVACAQLPNPYLRADEVIGIDLTTASMPENYDRFVQGDATRLTEVLGMAAVDVVVAGEFLEHLENPIDFLRECEGVLSNGGRLVLSTPNPNSPIERLLTLGLSRRYFYTADHIMLFPQRWLLRMLEVSGFADVRLFSGGFPCPGLGLVPFPRPFCHQTIATARCK